MTYGSVRKHECAEVKFPSLSLWPSRMLFIKEIDERSAKDLNLRANNAGKTNEM